MHSSTTLWALDLLSFFEDTFRENNPLFQFLRFIQTSLFALLNRSIAIFEAKAVEESQALQHSLEWIFISSIVLWSLGILLLWWHIRQIRQSLAMMIQCTFSIPRRLANENVELGKHLERLGIEAHCFFDREGQADFSKQVRLQTMYH